MRTLADESVLHQQGSVRAAQREYSSDLFGVGTEEGAIHGSRHWLRRWRQLRVDTRVIGCSPQRNVEAAIVVERRSSADMDAEDRVAGRVCGVIPVILIDLRRHQALTEIGR